MSRHSRGMGRGRRRGLGLSRLCLHSFQLTFGLTHASINVPQDLHIERGLETESSGKGEGCGALEGRLML